MPDTLGDRLKSWRALAEGLKPRIGEVSFLEADHTELTALVQQIDALLTQGDVHEGRLRETVRQRQIAEERIAELYGRMVARLKGTFGKRANVLTELGLKPEAVPGRPPKKDEEEDQPPAPAGTPNQPTAPVQASVQQQETPPGSDR